MLRTRGAVIGLVSGAILWFAAAETPYWQCANFC